MTPALRERIPAEWEPAAPEPGWHKDTGLSDSLRQCRAITRSHAKSFYFSSFPLKGGRKAAAFAVYAFCRWVDDEIDENLGEASQADTEAVRGRMLGELDRLLAGESALPFCPAFAAAVRQYRIPRVFLKDLIYGCCLDTETTLIEDYPQLERYCYYVASVVGLIMAKIFGLRSPEGVPRAVEMGLAMQLQSLMS